MTEETENEKIKRLEGRVSELEGELAARKKEVGELHIKRGQRNLHKAKRYARRMVEEGPGARADDS